MGAHAAETSHTALAADVTAAVQAHIHVVGHGVFKAMYSGPRRGSCRFTAQSSHDCENAVYINSGQLPPPLATSDLSP